MSVGAGSIKRAARTTNGSEEAAKKAGARAERAGEAEGKAEAKVEKEKAVSGRYEAYGVGQELPVHLM